MQAQGHIYPGHLLALDSFVEWHLLIMMATRKGSSSMATPIQRQIHNQHPGLASRLDYSNRQLRGPMPTSAREFEELMRRAHDPRTGGPGTADYSDLMALYQAGYDQNSFPEGGGIPRSADDTLAEVGRTQYRSDKAFVQDLVHPLLQELEINGQSLASLGPEAARREVALLMADCPPEQRNQLLEVVRAMDDSPVDNTGMSIDPSSLAALSEPRLEHVSVSGPVGGEDPSGLTQYFQDRGGRQGSLDNLMIRSQDQHPAFDGIVPGSTGGGGGEYRADLDAAMQAARGGGGTGDE